MYVSVSGIVVYLMPLPNLPAGRRRGDRPVVNPDGILPPTHGVIPIPAGRARNELWGWSALAICALAVAGIYAVLLVLSRTPFLENVISWPDQFFEKGLVAHATFSFVVWFLAVFGALVKIALLEHDLAAARRDIFGPSGLTAVAVGSILILVAPFIGGGEPSLNNYIPVIIHPVFYTGLVAIGLGCLLVVIRLLLAIGGAQDSRTPEIILLATGGLIYVAALAAIAVAFAQLGAEPISFDYNERLLWGGGHILQLLNLVMIAVVWDRLAQALNMGTVLSVKVSQVLSGLLVLTAVVGLSFFGIFDLQSQAFLDAFSDLQYAFVLPILLLAGVLTPKIWGGLRYFVWSDPAHLSLITSIVVFGVGAIFGLFVDGADTRTPAHYHGIIGGINLAFVGMFYQRFLPLLDRKPSWHRWMTAQIWLYAVGQLLFVIGMFAAGGMGATRKTAATAIDLDMIGALAASAIRDLGGGLAVLGGVLFIAIAATALFHHSSNGATNRQNSE